MTTEIEKQFFDTFGIEPNMCIYAKYGYESPEGTWYFCNKNRDRCWTYPSSSTTCKYRETSYPEITDHILLELMELLMKQQATEFYYNDQYLFSSKLLGSNRPTCNRIKNLRELVLRTVNCLGGFTPLKDEMLKQVRTLFREDGK